MRSQKKNTLADTGEPGDQPSKLTESQHVGAGRGLARPFPPLPPTKQDTEAHRSQVVPPSNLCPGVAEPAGTGPTALFSSPVSVTLGVLGKRVRGPAPGLRAKATAQMSAT